MWIGKPGLFLTVPDPTGEMNDDPDIGGSVVDLLQGRVVDFRGGRALRTLTMQFEGITADEWSILHGLVTRQYGPGPWSVYRPETRENLLAANQASGTDSERSPTGFAAAGTGETLASSTAQARSGLRSLLWSVPSSASDKVLVFSPPFADLDGWPTPAGSYWSLTAYCRSAGTDSTFDVRASLRWVNAAGSTVSTSTGTYTAMSSASWTRVTIAGTAVPATAVAVEPRLQIDSTDVSGAASLYVDDAQLEIGETAAAVPTAAIAGTGLRRASLLAPRRRQPVASWSTFSMTVQEV